MMRKTLAGLFSINARTQLWLSPVTAIAMVLLFSPHAALAVSSFVGIGTTAPACSLEVVGQNNGVAVCAGPPGSSNVGIGITNPGSSLSVVAPTSTISLFNVENHDFVAGTTGSGMYMNTGATSGSTYFGIQATVNGGANGGTLVLNPAGCCNVGIGTTSPASPLSVGGGISAGSYYGTAAPSNGMIISGPIGIGTASPQVALDVYSTTGITSRGPYSGIVTISRGNDSYASMVEYGPAGSPTASVPVWETGMGNNPDYSITTFDGHSYITRMVTKASTGNVGIGTLSPAYPLEVDGTGATAIYGYNSGSGNGLNGISASGNGIQASTNAGGSSVYGGVFTSGSYAGSIGRADGYAFVGYGAVWATGASYFNQSDARLKENVQTLPDAMENLLKLRPVSFQWKPGSLSHEIQGDKTQIGLIAQEVKEVFPEAVQFNKNPGPIKLKNGETALDAKLDGNYGVAYAYFVPLLIKGIQEIWGSLKELKQRSDVIHDHLAGSDVAVASLQAELAAVKSENAATRIYLCKMDPQAGFCGSSESSK